MSAVQSLDELADAVDKTVRSVTRTPLLVEARAACREAGIAKARADLIGALDILRHAQDAKRKTEAAERAAKEAHDDALGEAEWELDGRFVQDGNKTFLVDGDDRRQVLADEKAAWKRREARKLPAVARAAKVLAEATEADARARDDVIHAERRFAAARSELTAAVAVLETLRLGLEVPAR